MLLAIKLGNALEKKRAGGHLLGLAAQREAWPRATAGPRRESPRARSFLQRRACALWKSNDAVRYYFSRLSLCTKHLGKSYLHNGLVTGVPARGGAAHRHSAPVATVAAPVTLYLL